MKKYLLFIISFLFVLGSCTDEQEMRQDTPKGNINVPLDEEHVKSGVIRIKLTPEADAKLCISTTRSGELTTGIESLDALSSSFKISKIKQVFAGGGKYEERRRKAGLLLWYDIYFDEKEPMTRAFNAVLNIPEAQYVEPILKLQRIKGTGMSPMTQELAKELAVNLNSGTSEYPTASSDFNDPYLKYQWHYHNEGVLRHSLPGADINLLKAWEIETGKPQVIVAIIDGGIETTHPDIAPNLWVNQPEQNGSADMDDDFNGYTDDIHGYNFVFPHDNDLWNKDGIQGEYGSTDQGKVTGHEHGTHVAGTVAAVNNNGIGVCGVAGGNGDPNSGIRMMSCQIFAYDDEGIETSAEENKSIAFLYAAENGAVIAQNSWSYGWTGSEVEIMESDKEAINYFIDNAGKDEDGNQVGPMKGGIVIFATGNDNVNARTMPSSYERIFSVSSFRADYKRAVYSNYGSWVSVTSPGGDGDYPEGTQVFSTYMKGQYGFMAGTSMACPHVSGIAALVVSKYGVSENGDFLPFTNEDLKAKLLASTNDEIRWYNPASIPMGKGYINAYKALANVGKMAPDRVGNLNPVWLADRVKLSWKVTVDADDFTKKAKGYKLFISKSNLYGLDFSRLSIPVTQEILTGDKEVGETLSCELDGLEMGSTYYVSIAAFDADGNISLSSTILGEPVANRAPIAEGLPEMISLRKDEHLEIVLTVTDIEGDEWKYEFDKKGSKAISIKREDSRLILTFDATKETPGSTFEAVLKLYDTVEPDKVNEIQFTYSIVNNAPILLKQFPDILFHYIGEKKEYELDEYFTEKDKDAITYEITINNPQIVSATISANKLTVEAKGVGVGKVFITAKDPYNATVGTSFEVTSRDESSDVDLYPVPVKRDGVLNIRMGRYVEGNVQVTLNSLSGAKVFSQQVAISPDKASQVDLSSLKAGNYQIVVKYKQQEFTRNITKL